MSIEFICAVLSLKTDDTGDLFDAIWWRTDAPKYNPIRFFVNCNDLFYWGCADGERIQTIQDVEDILLALGDVREALGVPRERLHRSVTNDEFEKYYEAGGAQLWCARKRGMRPQSPWFKDWSPEVLALFKACGPERDKKDEG